MSFKEALRLKGQRGLTRLVGWLADCHNVFVKSCLIYFFVRRYRINLETAEEQDLTAYPNFNAFFTRALKKQYLRFRGSTNLLCSPVEGSLYQQGSIRSETIFHAKGKLFTLEALLGEKGLGALTNYYSLYLAPNNYHRVHMPVDGRLVKTRYIPGALFSVKKQTVDRYPQVFAVNERLVCYFQTDWGEIVVILVGAMIVGSIETVWENKVHGNQITTRKYPSLEYFRGEEIGRFNLGSTVILLLPDSLKAFSMEEGSKLDLGTPLGAFEHAS